MSFNKKVVNNKTRFRIYKNKSSKPNRNNRFKLRTNPQQIFYHLMFLGINQIGIKLTSSKIKHQQDQLFNNLKMQFHLEWQLLLVDMDIIMTIIIEVINKNNKIKISRGMEQ